MTLVRSLVRKILELWPFFFSEITPTPKLIPNIRWVGTQISLSDWIFWVFGTKLHGIFFFFYFVDEGVKFLKPH